MEVQAGGQPLASQLGTRRAARWVIAVYIAGAVTALLDVHVLRDSTALASSVRAQVTVLALVELAVAVLLWWLPWQRWSRAATLPLVAWALVLHTAFGLTGFMSPAVSVAFISAGFVWMGVFHSFRYSLLLVAPAAVSYTLPQWLVEGDPWHWVMLVVVVPVWLLIAGVLCRTVEELQRTHRCADHRAHLLERVAVAGRQLSHLHPHEVASTALGATRDLGAAQALLLFHLDSSTSFVRLDAGHHPLAGDDASAADRAAAQQVLDAQAAVTVAALIDDENVAGCRLLDTAVHAEPLELPAGAYLAHAPVAALGGHGSLIGVFTDGAAPAAAELQALELLANQVGQALSTASLFQHERRQSQRHAADARQDGLTGLGNRRVVESGLAAMTRGDLVVMLDLDHFKRINDTHGHAVGDDTLRHLATYLRGFARNQDVAARYGGEEFVLILHGAAEQADGAVDRLLAGWRAEEPLTTLSAGYAAVTGDCWPEEVLAAADAALYQAKRGGRDRAVRGGCADISLI